MDVFTFQMISTQLFTAQIIFYSSNKKSDARIQSERIQVPEKMLFVMYIGSIIEIPMSASFLGHE